MSILRSRLFYVLVVLGLVLGQGLARAEHKARPSSGMVAYGIGFDSVYRIASVYRIDTQTWAATRIGGPIPIASELAYDWQNGHLYSLTFGSPRQLYRVNMRTGEAVVIGTCPLPRAPIDDVDVSEPSGLAYDPVTKALYTLQITRVIAALQLEMTLFQIDPITAQITPSSSFATPSQGVGGMAFTSNGSLYLNGSFGLWLVDFANQTSSQVASTSHYISDVANRPDTHTLYAVGLGIFGDDPALYVVDSSGRYSSVAPLSNGISKLTFAPALDTP